MIDKNASNQSGGWFSSDKGVAVQAGVVIALLTIASAITVGLFGSGIYTFLTVNQLPPPEPLTAASRATAVAICLIPITLVAVVWALLLGWSRSLNAHEETTKGEQSSD